VGRLGWWGIGGGAEMRGGLERRFGKQGEGASIRRNVYPTDDGRAEAGQTIHGPLAAAHSTRRSTPSPQGRRLWVGMRDGCMSWDVDCSRRTRFSTEDVGPARSPLR